jgi:hypothetical protein
MPSDNYREFLGLPKLNFKKPKPKRVYKTNLVQAFSGDASPFLFPFLFFGDRSQKLPATPQEPIGPGSSVPPGPPGPPGMDTNNSYHYRPNDDPGVLNGIVTRTPQINQVPAMPMEVAHVLPVPLPHRANQSREEKPILNASTVTSIEPSFNETLNSTMSDTSKESAHTSIEGSDLNTASIMSHPSINRHIGNLPPKLSANQIMDRLQGIRDDYNHTMTGYITNRQQSRQAAKDNLEQYGIRQPIPTNEIVQDARREYDEARQGYESNRAESRRAAQEKLDIVLAQNRPSEHFTMPDRDFDVNNYWINVADQHIVGEDESDEDGNEEASPSAFRPIKGSNIVGQNVTLPLEDPTASCNFTRPQIQGFPQTSTISGMNETTLPLHSPLEHSATVYQEPRYRFIDHHINMESRPVAVNRQHPGDPLRTSTRNNSLMPPLEESTITAENSGDATATPAEQSRIRSILSGLSLFPFLLNKKK